MKLQLFFSVLPKLPLKICAVDSICPWQSRKTKPSLKMQLLNLYVNLLNICVKTHVPAQCKELYSIIIYLEYKLKSMDSRIV